MVLGQMDVRQSPSPSASPLVDALDGAAFRGVLTNTSDAFTRGVHRHPHGELFLLRSGFLQSESAAGRWLIPAGHLCWVPPFAEHGADTDSTQGVRIHLAAEFCTGVLPDCACVMRSTPLILAVIDRLMTTPTVRKSLSGRQRRLLDVLCDEIELARSKPIALPMPQDVRLRRTVERWLISADDRTGLDELAVEAGMSRRSFTRNFRSDTGLPIGEWRQIARLMHGIGMLAAGRSVTETAFALGYDSISSFVVLCQSHTGMSPKILARAVTGVG